MVSLLFPKGRQGKDLSVAIRVFVVVVSIGVLAVANVLAGCGVYAGPSDLDKEQSMPEKKSRKSRKSTQTGGWPSPVSKESLSAFVTTNPVS